MDLTVEFTGKVDQQQIDRFFAMTRTQSLTFVSKVKRWYFPKNDLVQYEQSDESWCRYFGIGKEIEVVEESVFPNCIPVACDGDSIKYRILPIEAAKES